MLKNVPISLSGPALKPCQIDILSNIGLGGYNNLIGSMVWQYFYTNYRCIMIFINY